MTCFVALCTLGAALLSTIRFRPAIASFLDAHTLLRIKDDLHDPDNVLVSWSLTSKFSLCTAWLGIECNSFDRVTKISLPVLNLGGSLPDTFQALDLLEELDLSGNNIEGQLPDFCFNPRLRKLFLQGNSFNGGFPFSNPSEWSSPLGRSIEILWLDGNELTGQVGSGPPPIFSATPLQELRLSGNKFFGPLPAGFEGFPDLQLMDLSGNNFSGPLPMGWTDFPKMESIDLSGNRRLCGGILQLKPSVSLNATLTGLHEDCNDGPGEPRDNSTNDPKASPPPQNSIPPDEGPEDETYPLAAPEPGGGESMAQQPSPTPAVVLSPAPGGQGGSPDESPSPSPEEGTSMPGPAPSPEVGNTPPPTHSLPSPPSPDTNTPTPRRPPIIIIPPIFPRPSGDPRTDTPSLPPPSPTSTSNPPVPTSPTHNTMPPSPTTPRISPPTPLGEPPLLSPPAPTAPPPPIKKEEGPSTIPEETPGMSVVTLPPLKPSPRNESPIELRGRSSNDPLQEAGVEFLSTGTALMMLAGVVLVSAVFAGLAYQAWGATFPPKISRAFNIRTNPMIYLSGDDFG